MHRKYAQKIAVARDEEAKKKSKVEQSPGFSRESVRITRASSIRRYFSDNAPSRAHPERINARELISITFCNSRFCKARACGELEHIFVFLFQAPSSRYCVTDTLQLILHRFIVRYPNLWHIIFS